MHLLKYCLGWKTFPARALWLILFLFFVVSIQSWKWFWWWRGGAKVGKHKQQKRHSLCRQDLPTCGICCWQSYFTGGGGDGRKSFYCQFTSQGNDFPLHEQTNVIIFKYHCCVNATLYFWWIFCLDYSKWESHSQGSLDRCFSFNFPAPSLVTVPSMAKILSWW